MSNTVYIAFYCHSQMDPGDILGASLDRDKAIALTHTCYRELVPPGEDEDDLYRVSTNRGFSGYLGMDEHSLEEGELVSSFTTAEGEDGPSAHIVEVELK